MFLFENWDNLHLGKFVEGSDIGSCRLCEIGANEVRSKNDSMLDNGTTPYMH